MTSCPQVLRSSPT